MKDNLIFYNSENNGKLSLLSLTENSAMNKYYRLYGFKDNKAGIISAEIPVPPIDGIFSQTNHFTYDKWDIDFTNNSVSIGNNTRFQFRILPRNPLWFYSQVPGTNNPSAFIPFPVSVCDKITNAKKK